MPKVGILRKLTLCNVHSPRFTSGATLADLLAAGAQLVTSPHACAEVELGSDLNVQPHEQKTNALPLCQRPGSAQVKFGLTSTDGFPNGLPIKNYNLKLILNHEICEGQRYCHEKLYGTAVQTERVHGGDNGIVPTGHHKGN